MTVEELQSYTIDVYEKCDIHSFPINSFHILRKYGFNIKKYCDLSERKQIACKKLSEDAAIIKDTFYYNQDKPKARIRFSTMHELGHVVTCSDSEYDADRFSSYILAPRMAIHYSNCKNQNDVKKIFNLSDEASFIAFNDYKAWYRNIVTHGNRMNEVDKRMYNHFYDCNSNKFVYSKKKCEKCGKVLINKSECEKHDYELEYNSSAKLNEDDFTYQFRVAELNWLYGGL